MIRTLLKLAALKLATALLDHLELDAAHLAEDNTLEPDPRWCPYAWRQLESGEHTCTLNPYELHAIHLCDCGATSDEPWRPDTGPTSAPASAEHWPPFALDKIRDAVAEDDHGEDFTAHPEDEQLDEDPYAVIADRDATIRGLQAKLDLARPDTIDRGE